MFLSISSYRCHITTKLTGGNEAQRNPRPVQRLVRQYDYSIKLRPAFVFLADVEYSIEQKHAEETTKCWADSEAD